MERTKLIQQIHNRLARLEDSREEARLANQTTDMFDTEIKELRIQLQDVMKSVCPIIE